MGNFSLKDQLFNADTLRDLSSEISAGLPGFQADRYVATVLSGFPERGLLERLEWMADCLEPYLDPNFPEMADQLTACMPAPLDPARTDDDFGRFIHALPGILAVRHGLDNHRDRALDLIYEATQRFSMEFYIRPFLNTWPDETLARLAIWAQDQNYHVRRLVSEGTRPRLPWAKAVDLSHDKVVPLLDALHGDATRYVTRSVSNHLNDIAKTNPDLMMDMLDTWAKSGQQDAKEFGWMTRHALRVLVKRGDARALSMMGFDPKATVTAEIVVENEPRIGGSLDFEIVLTAPETTPVLVDYLIWFLKSNGKTAPKVFKLTQALIAPGVPLCLSKSHKLKGDASTFRLFPGSHRVGVQVNGSVLADVRFELSPE